jgi:protein-disulfide isomerase
VDLDRARSLIFAIRLAMLVALPGLGAGTRAYAQDAAAPAATSSPVPTAPIGAAPTSGSAPPAPAAVIAAPIMAPIDQLMAIGPLPDLVQGSPSAPITIIEYASMTCSHCAAFHETTWPELKAKYIDTGRAKFILREFPLDPLATAGFMLARCAGPDKRNLFVDQLFSQQKTWAFVDRPIEPLLAMVKQIGMSQVDFETCLRNQDLYEQVSQSRERAAEAFNIDSTPTFFVNGRKLSGELVISDFDRVIDPPAK